MQYNITVLLDAECYKTLKLADAVVGLIDNTDVSLIVKPSFDTLNSVLKSLENSITKGKNYLSPSELFRRVIRRTNLHDGDSGHAYLTFEHMQELVIVLSALRDALLEDAKHMANLPESMPLTINPQEIGEGLSKNREIQADEINVLLHERLRPAFEDMKTLRRITDRFGEISELE